MDFFTGFFVFSVFEVDGSPSLGPACGIESPTAPSALALSGEVDPLGPARGCSTSGPDFDGPATTELIGSGESGAGVGVDVCAIVTVTRSSLSSRENGAKSFFFLCALGKSGDGGASSLGFRSIGRNASRLEVTCHGGLVFRCGLFSSDDEPDCLRVRGGEMYF